MKSDKSRDTFHPTQHYSSVRLQQGRVLTDADWNEQADIARRRDETTAIDVIGATGVPDPPDGFRVMGTVQGTVADLALSAGRMYVDGIQCEHEGGITYRTQPDLPLDRLPAIPSSGSFAAYLEVWDRHIGSLQDPSTRETALGGPDTATRAKTVWQLKFLRFPGTTLVNDIENRPEWLALTAPSTGRMRARARVESSSADPCIIPEAAGFRRLENQLYRVEIHVAGTLGAGGSPPTPPTFKWSRDNGSVVATWDDAPGTVNQIRVTQTIRDETLGFAQGQWIELSDDTRELHRVPGLLVQILRVDGDLVTYDPNTIRDPDQPSGAIIAASRFPKNRTVRRWDMTSDPVNGAITVSRPAANDGYLALESGVEVRFEDGTYKVGDYWLIPARTITSTIEWPTFTTGPDALLPQGTTHHFACLYSFTMPGFGATLDCRKRFLPLTKIPSAAPTADIPRPGQFRFYLIDGAAGNDSTGVVGIGFDATSAFAQANGHPFRTFARVIELLPRDGMDSTATILIKPLPGGASYGTDFRLTGVHGYRRLVIRGSNLVNDLADQDLCAPEPVPAFPNGILLTGSRVRPAFEFALHGGEEELLFSPTQLTPAQLALISDQTSLVGYRTRYPNDTVTQALRNIRSMIMRHQPQSTANSDGQPVIRILAQTPGVAAQAGDRLLIERPGVKLRNFSFSTSNSFVSVAGIHADLMVFQELDRDVAVSFCETPEFSASRFRTINLDPGYTSEANAGFPGAGLRGEFSNILSNGRLVTMNSCSGRFNFERIDTVNVIQGVLFSGRFEQETSFNIGFLNPGTIPRFVTLGDAGPAGRRPVIDIRDSGGRLEDAFFNDTSAPPTDTAAAISVQGFRRNLEIGNVTHGRSPSEFMDLTGATASEIRLDPTAISSGVIRLPTGTTFDSPTGLRIADVIDFGGNHIQGPAGGYVQKGIGLMASEFIQLFTLVRFPGVVGQAGPEPRIGLARLQPGETAAQFAASIAGIAQQRVLVNTDQRTMVVNSGYSIALLDGPSNLQLPTIQLPATVFASAVAPGSISFTPAPNMPRVGVAIRQQVIGILIRLNLEP